MNWWQWRMGADSGTTNGPVTVVQLLFSTAKAHTSAERDTSHSFLPQP